MKTANGNRKNGKNTQFLFHKNAITIAIFQNVLLTE